MRRLGSAGTVLHVFSVLFLATVGGAAAQVPVSERQALVELHASLGGEGWHDDSGWLGAAGTECSWFGIACSAGSPRVIGIVLRGNGLRGTLPDVFAALPLLEGLDLNGNDLRGTFPPSLGSLPALRDLSLGDHEGDGELGGVLPDLSALTLLERLDLQGQEIEGPLPALSALGNLEGVGLSGNRFVGSIPSLAGLDQLVALDLSENRLSGEIPAELSTLTALEEINLANNREAIDDVRERCVGPFDGGLTGEIPDLRALGALRQLVLDGNLLDGEFPLVEGLSNLVVLDVSDNCLDGELPGDVIGTLVSVAFFLVASNDFTGEIPAEIGQLPSLTEELDLSGNRFTGAIPDLSDLGGLDRLFLQANALQGEIPESLRFTGVVVVDPEQRCEQCLGLDYNALSARTASAELRSWLAARAGEWELTQTTPPRDVRVVPRDESSVIVAWRPIGFRGFAGEDGRYVVSAAGSAGGPFQVVGDTSDPEPGLGKETNQLVVDGLGPEQRSFRVEAQSDPHPWNQNQVRSLPSTVVSGSAGTLAVGSGAEDDVGGDDARETAIATSSSGARAVVWSEASTGVVGRIFDPSGNAGPPFVVTSDRRAHDPSVSWSGVGPDEQLVVVWVSGGSSPAPAGTGATSASSQGSILGRTFAPGGNPPSGGAIVGVSQGPGGEQPRVAGTLSGPAIVVWRTDAGVVGSKLAPGSAGEPFPVDDGDGADAEVAAARDGGFVVVWEEAGGVAGKLFGADGSPREIEVPQAGQGGIGEPLRESRLRLGDSATARNPAVAISGEGDIVVAWDDLVDGRDVRGKVFERGGLPISGELGINQGSAGDQTEPMVRANVDGDFVVSWLGHGEDSGRTARRSLGRSDGSPESVRFDHHLEASQGTSIVGRHFDPGGAPQGDDVSLGDANVASGDPRPDVAIDDEDLATVVFTRRRGGGGGEGVFRRDFEAERPVQPRACAPSGQDLCLAANRFEVSASFRTASDVAGEGAAVPLTADTGFFWFFEATNVELVVKVLDGCGINGRFWVFAGGLTDVEVDLEVHDTQRGTSRRYFNVLGRPFQPIQDTSAFATCGAASTAVEDDARVEALAREAREELARLASTPAAEIEPAVGEALAAGACATSGSRLCVTGNRFEITVDWRTTDGAAGSGQAAQLTSDTGTFWFFDAANVEVVIKVLNACTINQRFWVFATGLTDVEAVLTVTDTTTGVAQSYSNTLGTPFQPIQDTSAFATCP